MFQEETNNPDRRTFLQAGALATAVALGATSRRGGSRRPRQAVDSPQTEARQDRC